MVWQPPKDKSVYNLDNAYHIVVEHLANTDVTQQCHHSGAELQLDGTVELKYLNQNYIINPGTAEVSMVDNPFAVPVRDKILILHYFTWATGTNLSGKLVTFRDLPGGLVYYPTFIKRTVQPLIDAFGKDASLLVAAGQSLGARQGKIGDISLVIDAFPRVPITIVLWQGDDELTPSVNLLFDAGITDYLESEDVTIVCETITWRLINSVKKAQST